MTDKVQIEIFGLWDAAPAGDCACSDDCGPECGSGATMGEMYQELVAFFGASEMRDKVDIRFVDVIKDSLDPYETARIRLDRGCKMPLTAVNGKMRFYGAIDPALVFEQAQKHADTYVFEMQ
ncbi:MAG: hypothetical protein M0T74_07775 [Desulfitobacterium hafniense]|nr:hypothetical protein [Desulfitobacterium hafniense]